MKLQKHYTIMILLLMAAVPLWVSVSYMYMPMKKHVRVSEQSTAEVLITVYNMYKLIWSLRRSGSTAQVLIFQPDTLPINSTQLNEMFGNVSTVAFTKTESSLSFVLERFLQYDLYFRNHSSLWGKVIVADPDHLFFRDPFKNFPLEPSTNSIAIFGEHIRMLIKDCNLHLDWIGCLVGGHDKISPEVLKSTRICAGTTFGTSKGMAGYLELMAKVINSTKCNDQGVHNYLYYYGNFSRYGINVTKYEEGEGPIGTIGTTPTLKLNDKYEVLDDSGNVYAGVHQYKHHGSLTKQYDEMYPFKLEKRHPNQRQ